MKSTWYLAPGFSILLLLPGCGSKQDSVESPPSPPVAASDSLDDSAAPVASVGLPNERVFEGNLLGGALTTELLREAHEAGYKSIINLRTADEGGVDEQRALAEELGMTYVHIPIVGPDGLTKENADALNKALSNEGPAVVHCGSGNRVGAMFGMRAFHVHGKSAEEAMAIAESAGVTKLKEALQTALGGDE